MSERVWEMAEGPVCAWEEWRRERVWGSGIFLGRSVSWRVLRWGVGFGGGFFGGRGKAYQCGQRNVASEVVSGAIVSAVRFGVVRRVRTGAVLEEEDSFLGVEVGGGGAVVDGADVGWIGWWEDSGEWMSDGGCEMGFVAPRAGEPGWEAAREA